MSINGYIDYQRREFCKDVQCPLQMDLEVQQQGSEAYEKIRQGYNTNCRYTAYQFHHWLINKGYLVVRPE
jgi:hypothetical protein